MALIVESALDEANVLITELLERCGEDANDDCPTPHDLCGNRICENVGCYVNKVRLIRQALRESLGERRGR